MQSKDRQRHWLFQHGWGFDRTFWDPLKNFIPKEDQLTILDRGYFGNTRKSIDNHPYHTIVAHSFGLHLLPKDIFNHCETLMIFGGFQSFQSSKAALKTMIKNFQAHPTQTLKMFYQQCFSPSSYCQNPVHDLSSIDVNLLHQDLCAIRESFFDAACLTSVARVQIFHGECDRIIPVEMGKELHQAIPQSRFVIIPEAGHALPLTHPKQCEL